MFVTDGLFRIWYHEDDDTEDLSSAEFALIRTPPRRPPAAHQDPNPNPNPNEEAVASDRKANTTPALTGVDWDVTTTMFTGGSDVDLVDSSLHFEDSTIAGSIGNPLGLDSFVLRNSECTFERVDVSSSSGSGDSMTVNVPMLNTGRPSTSLTPLGYGKKAKAVEPASRSARKLGRCRKRRRNWWFSWLS